MDSVDINVEEFNEDLATVATVLADAYIKRCGKPSVEDLFKEEGTEFVPGKLYSAHVKALQIMLKDEYKLLGLDLVAEVEKNGEKFVLGQFSKYETKIIVNKSITAGCLIDRVREIKEGK
jgi:hypothetical protein